MAAASLGLAACRVDATVEVRVAGDGSGTVTARVHLDPAAARAAEAGGDLAGLARVSDLAGAGWDVRPWARDEAGGATLAMTKRFARPEDLAGVLAELGGPVRSGSLDVDESVARTTYRLAVDADLSAAAPGVAADPELAAALTAAGVDPAAVEARLAGPLTEALSLRLRAALPGGGEGETEVVAGGSGRLEVSSSTVEVRRLVLLAAGGVLALGALTLLVVGERRDRLRRARAAGGR